MDDVITIKTEGGGNAPTERQSGIELFRIVIMMLIIAHHYVVNSGLTLADGPVSTDPLSWRSLFLSIFGAWGKAGINCFVLITGYFMCKSKITMKKFMKLLLEVMFYGLLIKSIFWITGYSQFIIASFVMALIPVTTISTGFTNAFIVFYLLIPFLSILVQNMNERQHIMLIAWCSFTYILLGTIPGFSVTMNYVSWYSVLFIVASYLRMYPKKAFENTKLWAVLTAVSTLLAILSVIVCSWLRAKVGIFGPYSFVVDSNSFLAFAVGLASFMLFKNLRIGYRKTINTIAVSTFGVFLIHTRGDAMRHWLWVDTLDVVGHYGSKYMPLHAIGSVLAIFIICTIIDQLRIRFIEKPFFRLWDKHWDGFLVKYKKIESKVISKLGIQE